MNDQPFERTNRFFRWVLACAGLAQGLGYYLLFEVADDSDSTLAIALMVFLLVAPLSFQLSFGLGSALRTAIASVGFGAVSSLLWLWLDARLDWAPASPPFRDHLFLFAWTMTGGAYIILPFIQTWLSEGGWRFPYPQLFRFSWNNILVAAIAGVFLGTFWLVLLLWWSLFELVGVSFFYDLFSDALFAWVFSGGVLGLGIAIARENERIVPTFRRVVLTLFQILAPVLAVAALLFLLFLPFTGLDPLWETKRATPILVALMFAVVLAVNAVIQDGTLEERENPVIAWLIATALLLLPVYAGLAFYSTWLRIDQYGVTPDRYIARLVVLAASAHVIVYAVAVAVRRLAWRDWVCRANPYLAAAVAAVVLLLQTPVLDPYRATATDQFARLMDGRTDVGAFDFAFLKFKLGEPGRAVLAALKETKDHPDQAQIDAALDRVRDADSYYEIARNQPRLPLDDAKRARQSLIVKPAGTDVSDTLWRSLERQHQYQLERCAEGKAECGVLGLDVDRDGGLEFVFLNSEQKYNAYIHDPDNKQAFSWLSPIRTGADVTEKDARDLWKAFVAGDYEVVEPTHFDIRLGNQVFSY